MASQQQQRSAYKIKRTYCIVTIANHKLLVTGAPDAASDLLIVEVGATNVTLGWTHNSSHAAESFTINCTALTPTANTISTVIHNPTPTMENTNTIDNNTFVYFIAGLEAHSNYTCTITASNVFGRGPTSEITIRTNQTGISKC